MAQILKTPCTINSIGYPLYEITSSGLGHYCKPNCDLAIDHVLPRFYQHSATVDDYNFAQLYFDWGKEKKGSKFLVKIVDIEGKVRMMEEFKLTDLTIKNRAKTFDLENDECYISITRRFQPLSYYVNFIFDRKENGLYLLCFLAAVAAVISVVCNVASIVLLGVYCKRKKAGVKLKTD